MLPFCRADCLSAVSKPRVASHPLSTPGNTLTNNNNRICQRKIGNIFINTDIISNKTIPCLSYNLYKWPRAMKIIDQLALVCNEDGNFK